MTQNVLHNYVSIRIFVFFNYLKPHRVKFNLILTMYNNILVMHLRYIFKCYYYYFIT